MRELKPRLMRRGGVVVACLAVGLAGVAWSGCGGNGDAKSVEEKVQTGLNEGRKADRKGLRRSEEGPQGKKNKAANETIEKAEEATEEGIEKGKETAKSVTEEVEKAQAEYGTP